jgi:hypothetical protein
MNESIESIPFMGGGLGYRHQIHDGILENKDKIDFVEIITEKYIGNTKKSLDSLARISDVFPVIPHGVSLSIGTHRKVSMTFLKEVKKICEIVKAPYYSDHFAITECPGIDFGHLSSLVFNDVSLAMVIDNVNRTQDYLGIPLVLENITRSVDIPGQSMAEEDFIHKVVDSTSCGILLDVANLYINSVNFKFDPIEYAKKLPLKSVVQFHLAGGVWHKGTLIDSHSEDVHSDVWDLMSVLQPLTNARGSIVERDDNYPEFKYLLSEVQKSREILSLNR